MAIYETDFYGWIQEQVEALASRQWERLDLPHLLEELTDLGRRECQELRNRWGLLLGHLLKWPYQPELRGNRWRATIREQRREIYTLLEDNPSLTPYMPEALVLGYQAGLDLAVRETGLDYTCFPEVCPYTLEQSLKADFFPL